MKIGETIFYPKNRDNRISIKKIERGFYLVNGKIEVRWFKNAKWIIRNGLDGLYVMDLPESPRRPISIDEHEISPKK